MPTIDQFREELGNQLSRAELSGAGSVEINSGQLHRDVGGYPGPKHAMPSCCDAMMDAKRTGDIIISQPPKGKGATLTIRFKLPR